MKNFFLDIFKKKEQQSKIKIVLTDSREIKIEKAAKDFAIRFEDVMRELAKN